VGEFSKPHATRAPSIDPIDPVDSPVAGDPVVGIDEAGDAISEAELNEFLAADPLSAPADPAFKRRLRGRLWDIVQSRLSSRQSRRDEPLDGWRRREVPLDSEPGADPRAKRDRGPT